MRGPALLSTIMLAGLGGCETTGVSWPSPTLSASTTETAYVLPETGRIKLRHWLNHQFTEVGSSCVAQYALRAPGDAATPRNIQRWGPVARRWDKEVTVYDSSSLGDLFSRVYRQDQIAADTDRTPENRYQPIGITYPQSAGTILYLNRSSLRRTHNCSTILAAGARANMRLTLVDLNAALEASTSRTETETAFAYAGTMVSPVTASLGRNTTAVDAPANVSTFSVLLALWNWYRNHPDAVEAGREAKLLLLNQIDGMAMSRVSGLTQRAMLTGSASIEGSVPFLSARASASGTTQADTTAALEDYSIAVWNTSFVPMPRPSEIAAQAARIASFSPADGVPQVVDGSAFAYSVDLANLSSNYCQATQWTLKSAAQTTSAATLTRFTMQPVPGSPLRCRISMSAIAPAKTTGNVEIAFSLESTALNVETPLILQTPSFNIRDQRAAISLSRASGPALINFPDNSKTDPVPVTLRVPIVGEVEGIISSSSVVSVGCGSDTATPISAADLEVDLEGNVLTVEINMPYDVLSTPAADCRVLAQFTLEDEDDKLYPSDMPTFGFRARRAVLESQDPVL